MHEHTVEVVEFNICRQFISKRNASSYRDYINEVNDCSDRINFDLLNSELKKAMRAKPLPYNFSDDDLYEILSSQDCAFFTKKTPMGISKKHIYKGVDTHDFSDSYAYMDKTKELFKKKLERNQVLINFLENNFDVYKTFLQEFQQAWNFYAQQVVAFEHHTDEAVLREWIRRHNSYKVHCILGIIFFTSLPFILLFMYLVLNVNCFRAAVIGFYIEPINIFWGAVVHPAFLRAITFNDEYPYDTDVLKGCGFDERKTKGAVLTGAAIGKFLK